MRKKQQAEDERPVTSELKSAQCPRASLSPQRERAFACPLHFTMNQRSFTVSDMISFCASDGEIDETFFLELSGSVTDPRPLTVVLFTSRQTQSR